MTQDAGARPPRPRSRDAGIDRRTLILSAALLLGAIVLGVGAVAVFSDGGTPSTTTTTIAGSEASPAPPPAIVPKPNTGTAPESPGDRGGWEQLTLLALIVGAMVGIGLVIARGGGRKAKANRQAWRDAAATPAPARPTDTDAAPATTTTTTTAAGGSSDATP